MLKVYLGFAPSDTTALVKYATLIDRTSKSPRARRRAIQAFEEVLTRDPNQRESRLRLAQAQLDLKDYRDAAGQFRTLLKSTPNNGALELALGQCLEGQGEFAAAADLYQKAGDHDSSLIDSFRQLGEMARGRLKQNQRGDDALDRAVKFNPNAFKAYLARGQYRLQFGLDGAAGDIARARALQPDDADVILATVAVARAQGKVQDARTTLAKGIEKYPQDFRMYRDLAELEVQGGTIEAAIACLERGVKALPNRADLRLSLVDAQVRADRLDDAAKTVAALRKEKYLPEVLDFLDARILFGRRKWVEAARGLDRVGPIVANRPELGRLAYWLLAACHEQMGNQDLRLDAARHAVDLDASWVPARLALAYALQATGREDDALTEFRAVASQLPEARTAAARLTMRAELDKPEADRKWAEAEAAIEQIAQSNPKSADVAILRAELEAARGRIGAAARTIAQARKANPENVALVTVEAALAQRNEGPDRALALLGDAQKHFGDLPALRLARLRIWASRRDQADRAKAAIDEIGKDIDRFSVEDQCRLLDGMAEAAQMRGDRTEAGRLWILAAERDPQRINNQTHLFDLAFQLRDQKAMERALAQIRTIEGPKGPLGNLAESGLAIVRARNGDRSGLATARTRVADLATRRPTWGMPLLLEAEIAELEGDQSEALDAYLKAMERGERRPQTVRRAVQLLMSRHRYAEADQAIRALQKQAPINGELSRIAAEVSLFVADPDRALDLARQAVAEDSSDYHDQLWLGQVLNTLGKKPEAEAALRRAATLAPEQPEVWVALVRFLALDHRTAQADAALAEARRKLPAPRAPLILALGEEALFRREKAAALYKEALKATPDDPAVLRCAANFDMNQGLFPEAEPLLRRLIEPAVKADDGDRLWARRNLAVGLAASGDDRKSQEAMALVDQNLKVGNGQLEDRRARALVLALNPERRRDSIRELESLLSKQVPSAEEVLLLARLLEIEQDWYKARTNVLGLISQDPKDTRPLHFFIPALLRHGEVDEAQTWLTRLEALDPDSFATAELKARVLAAQHRGSEAAVVLTDSAGKPNAPLPRLVALLEELKQPAAAESLYQKLLAGGRPEVSLAFASFLGRQGRADAALDRCEPLWKTLPPVQVGAACVAIVAASPINEARFQRVSGWLNQAIHDHPDLVRLREELATLCVTQAHYTEAERLFREAIRRNGNDVVALNNLAWVLTCYFGKHKEALETIERALKASGPRPSLLDTRSQALLALGRAEAAVRDSQQATQRAPKATALFHLSQALLATNDRAAAVVALAKAHDAGLTLESLHPLERDAYQKLTRALGRDAAIAPKAGERPQE